MKNVRLFLSILVLGSLPFALFSCAGPVQLNEIVVAPATPSIPVGVTLQFTATGYYNNGTSQDLTRQVTWSSSDTTVATVDSNGLATGVGPGTTNIVATSSTPSSFSSSGSSGKTLLTVNYVSLNSITVAPANPSLPAGVNQQFTATGTYSDGTSHDITTQVAWSSSDVTVATISAGGGLATTVAAGTTTITALAGTISGTTILTVNAATLNSITVTPASPSFPAGVTRQFTATGLYSDGNSYDITARVTWSSSNPAAATVSAGGIATTVAFGTTTIAAASGGISGNTTLTVNAAALNSISVTPGNPGLPGTPAGITRQFTATGSYSDGTSYDITTQVTWSSSNPAAATISASGLATAVAAGATSITAASGGISGGTTLTVNTATLTSISVTLAYTAIPVGAVQQFKATASYSDGTSYDITALSTWTSSVPTVATIDATGLATAVAAGVTTFTATSGGVSGSTTFTVF